MENTIANKGEVIIYQTEDGLTKLEVTLENESVWLTQEQIAMLFGKDRTVIGRHIRNIFDEGELQEELVCAKFAHTTQHGAIEGLTQTHTTTYYNLDVIISVGYRVKSIRGTQFRQWATKRIHEYIIKGFTIDDERLKGNGGGAYWKELLDRIRDIRSSEKVMYRQVLDIYATAVDYDPKSMQSIEFFKIVQNKLHFAAHGHTASEVIYERADAGKGFMGMTSFKGSWPTLRDAQIAKNYLSHDELKILNNIVSGYFDFAEVRALRHVPTYMTDYIQQLDSILTGMGSPILLDAGKISHDEAMNKAEMEYRQWQQNTLSPVEVEYLNTIKSLENKGKNIEKK